MQPCQPLQPLEGNTGADLTKSIVENAARYWSCADGKQALIDAVSSKEVTKSK